MTQTTRERWMPSGTVPVTAEAAQSILSGQTIRIEEHPACADFVVVDHGTLTLWLDEGNWDWTPSTPSEPAA